MSNGEYEVGYGKPPISGQFKPGQSGNRLGRPRRAKSIQDILGQVLDEKVSYNVKGHVKRVSVLEFLVRKGVSDALKGDRRTLEIVLKLRKEHDRPDLFVCEPIDGDILAELIATAANPIGGDTVEPGDAKSD